MTTTIKNFVRAANAHLHLASSVDPDKNGVPQGVPSTMAYLASVAVENSLKSLILKAARLADTESLRKAQPRLYKQLFAGKAGHSLTKLAQQASVVRHLGDAAPTSGMDAWKRMCHEERPYAVRYGKEELSSADARAEVDLAIKLHENIKSLLGRVR